MRSTGHRDSSCGRIPFPCDDPNFLIFNMDVKTGKTTINWDVVLKQPGERHVIYAYNTKSYWPMSLGEGGTTARGLARRGEGRAKREPDRAKPQKEV